MEEDKGAALSRMAEQYELVADILGNAFTYAGVLNRREIMAALDTALEVLDTDFNDDFERVEDLPGGVEDAPVDEENTPKQQETTPLTRYQRDLDNLDDR